MLNPAARRRATTSPNPRRRFALAAGAAAMLLALVMPGGAASAANIDVVAGDVGWGVKASFVNYITGPIAKGSYETTGGATSGFNFPGATGTADGDTFSVAVNGGVTFRGHDYGKGHLLELSISNIRLTRTGSTGTLIADVSSRALTDEGEDGGPGPLSNFPGVVVANLNFSGAGPVAEGGTTTFSNIPASLDAGAIDAFAHFYLPGDALDPVTITLTTRAEDGDPDGGSSTTTTTTTASTGSTSTTVAPGTDPGTDGSGTTPPTNPDGSPATTTPPAQGGTGSNPGAVQGGTGTRATPLARTGSSSTPAAVGLALVLSGAAALAASRRARSTTI